MASTQLWTPVRVCLPETRLGDAMQARLARAGERLQHLGQMLDSLSPLRTLDRGYAIVTDARGVALKNADRIKVGDSVQARLAQGRLGLRVESVEKSDEA